jgi:hypothetical protein
LPARRSEERLCRRPVPIEPQGAHVTVAGDRLCDFPKEGSDRSRSSKKWLRAQHRNSRRIRVACRTQ